MFVPGAPAGTHFPPAFPLLLAALWKVAPAFPASVTLFKLLNAVMLAVAALATFVVRARPRRSRAVGRGGVALAFAGSVPVLFLDGVLFSEPFFIAALLGALMLAERAHGRAVGGAGAAPRAGAAATPACRRRRRDRRRDDDPHDRDRAGRRPRGHAPAATAVARPRLLALAGIALSVVPWQLWTMRHGGEIPPILSGDYGTYGSWVAAALHTEGVGFIARVAAANLKGFAHLLRPVRRARRAARGRRAPAARGARDRGATPRAPRAGERRVDGGVPRSSC